jgi:hypothetical protein
VAIQLDCFVIPQDGIPRNDRMKIRPRLSIGVLFALLAAGLITLAFQRHSQSRLRGEITVLRTESREANRLRRDNQRLTGTLAPPDELENLRSEQSELARLRSEATALRDYLQLAPRRETPPPPAAKPLAPGMIPVDNLTNAGAATPAAAARSFFWAVAQADPDAMAKQLAFGDAARSKADALFASLDAAARERIGTPEKLLAMFFTTLYGRVTGLQTVDLDKLSPDAPVWNVKVQTASGKLSAVDFPLRHLSDGWREEVPVGMVDYCSYYLRGKM